MTVKTLAFTAAEIAAMSAFNADSMPENVRAQLANLDRITGVLAEAKNVQNNASTEKGNAWGALLNVAFAVAEATENAKRIREMAFNSVLKDYVEAEKDSSRASLKSYVSTARNVLLKMYGVTHTAEQIEAMSYKDVREFLSPKADADFAAKVKEVSEHLRYVEKQVGKVKKAEDAATQMALLHSVLDDILSQSKDIRNLFKSENDSNSVRANLARELHDQKPKAPTAPAVLNPEREAQAA